MERRQNCQFFFSVFVQINQDGITCCCVKQGADRPVASGRLRRDKLEYSAVCRNNAGVGSLVVYPVVAVVFQHIVFYDFQFQLVVFPETA